MGCVVVRGGFDPDPDVSDWRCGPGARWCARADALFNVPGPHVLDVEHRDRSEEGLVARDAAVGDRASQGAQP